LLPRTRSAAADGAVVKPTRHGATFDQANLPTEYDRLSMRLLFLSSGDSIHTRRWLDFFSRRGDECHLISIQAGPRLVEGQLNLRDDRRATLLDSLRALPAVRGYIARTRPDLISAHYLTNYGLIAALLDRHPWTLTCWGPEVPLITERSTADRLRARFVCRRADHVTAAGRAMLPYLRRYGVRPERLAVWPKGIDPHAFPPGHRLEERETTIVHTRTLDRFYRVEVLLRALARARRSRSELRLELLGAGNAEDELRSLTTELGISEAVRFRGPQPPGVVGAALGRAALYVVTVPVDAYAFSLVEALACGAYPIVPDHASNREVLQDCRGALYPAGDVEALTQRILTALDDTAERRAAVEVNRRTIERRGELGCNLGGIARAWEALVETGTTG
jgi:glycosyltransferase involved in cell wall biosynthesis